MSFSLDSRTFQGTPSPAATRISHGYPPTLVQAFIDQASRELGRTIGREAEAREEGYARRAGGKPLAATARPIVRDLAEHARRIKKDALLAALDTIEQYPHIIVDRVEGKFREDQVMQVCKAVRA